MPEPWRYLQAWGLAACVGGAVAWGLGLVLTVLRRGQPCSRPAGLLSIGLLVGLMAGYGWLGVRWNGPPANGLNRMLWLVLPATLAVELAVACSTGLSRRAWLWRGVLALAVPRVLLNGSVHLAVEGGGSAPGRLGMWGGDGRLGSLELVGLGGVLLGVWWLLGRLSQRSGGAGVPVVLALTLLASGACVMLGGYLKGGAAAFPLAGVTTGVSLVTWAWQRRSSGGGRARNEIARDDGLLSPVVAVGVVGLFGLLVVGCAFGRLLTWRGVVLGLAPLLYAAPLGPGARHWGWAGRMAVRLVLVAAMLGLVLAAAKADFDRSFRPLLGSSTPGARQADVRSVP